MRRRSAAALAVAMVATVAAGPSEDGATVSAEDPCGDGGLAIGVGPTTVGPYDSSATDLAALHAVQVRDEDGATIGLDLVVEVCGEAFKGDEQEHAITVGWLTDEEDENCFVYVDLQSNAYFVHGADGLHHESMTYGCQTPLPENVPQTWTPKVADGLDQVTVPIEVTTEGSRYLVSLRHAELGELAALLAPGEVLRDLDVYGSTRYLSYDNLDAGDLVLEED